MKKRLLVATAITVLFTVFNPVGILATDDHDSETQGPAGPQGPKGDKGDKGNKGDKGDKGSPGQNGHDGKDGTNGRNGEKGADGQDGKDGTDAKPADDLEHRLSVNVGAQVRWYDWKHIALASGYRYDVNHQGHTVDALIVQIKIGKSYEERRLAELQKRLDRLDKIHRAYP